VFGLERNTQYWAEDIGYLDAVDESERLSAEAAEKIRQFIDKEA
jgi:hypothetical protein